MKFPIVIVILMFFFPWWHELQAQSSGYTAGKEFWLGFMKNNEVSNTDELRIEITAVAAAYGQIEVAGADWSQSFYVDPGSVYSVLIPNDIAEVLTAQVVENRGVHITSDQDISVVAFNYENSTSDAARILPVDLLGTNYFVSAYSGSTGNESEILIVAAEDNTAISVVPSAVTNAGNAAGVPFTIMLQAGECYQILASGAGDLTGTILTTTAESGDCRPFAVFSGAGCANVPVGCSSACDHLWEQNYPVNIWGSDFYITPMVFDLDPNYGVPEPRYSYRVLAAFNGTTVSVDGVSSFSLNAGDFQEFNGQETAHCISSNQPIQVTQYLEGISCGGNGDPSMIILDDISKQFDECIFTISDIGAMNTHFINIVVDAAALGSVYLDGNLISPNQFEVFSGCTNQLWCGIEIDAGTHELSASEGINVIVYGHADGSAGVSESYAFPLSAYIPQPPIEVEETFCGFNPLILEVPDGFGNAYWYNVNEDDVIVSNDLSYVVPTPIENALYGVLVTEVVSGCESNFFFSVENPEPITLTLNVEETVICEHQSVSLQASALPSTATYNYAWFPATGLESTTTSSVIASPDASTTYTVSVTTPGGCAVATASTTIIVNEGDVARFQTTDEMVRICEGEDAQLGLSIEQIIWRDNFNPSISWGDWEDILGGGEDIVCGAVSGNSLYFNGTFPREAVTQPMDLTNGGHIYFSLKIANGTAPCDDAEAGDNIVLAYSINNGVWMNIQTFYESSFPDFIDVVVAVPVGAMANSVRLRWRQVGSYTNNQDNWVLDNMYVGVNQNISYDVSWSPAFDINNTGIVDPLVSPSTDMYYFVEAQDPATGCLYRDSVWVSVGDSFSLIMSEDTSMCDAAGLMLSAQPDIAGDYEYFWTPDTEMQGSYSASPWVSPSTTTTYSVTATSADGCTAEGEIDVVVSALLDLTVVSSDTEICGEETITLDASLAGNPAGVSFEWIGDTSIADVNSSSTSAQPLTDVVFTCTATHDESGCSVMGEVSVDVTPLFTIDPTPDFVTSCTSVGYIVSAAPSYPLELTWNWSPSNMVEDPNAQTTTLITNNSGMLTVTATSETGCTAVASLPVDVEEMVTDLGEDAGICIDESVTIETGWPEEFDFIWSTGEQTSSIVADEGGIYHVTVVDLNGCVSEDEIVITEFDYPEVDLGPDTSLCEGATLILDAGSPLLNYSWNTDDFTWFINVTETGIYHVSVDNGYCFTEDEIGVEFNPLPVQPFASEIEHCFSIDPEGFYLDAENNGSNYLWNDESTTRALLVTSPGAYDVVVTTAQFCSAQFEVSIEEVCPVTIYAPNSFTPDGDGVNDVWFVYGENIVNYHLRLYNRLGEKFFESTDINTPWLGQRRDNDMYVEPGVYEYLITFQYIDENGMLGEEQILKGFVTLIR